MFGRQRGAFTVSASDVENFKLRLLQVDGSEDQLAVKARHYPFVLLPQSLQLKASRAEEVRRVFFLVDGHVCAMLWSQFNVRFHSAWQNIKIEVAGDEGLLILCRGTRVWTISPDQATLSVTGREWSVSRCQPECRQHSEPKRAGGHGIWSCRGIDNWPAIQDINAISVVYLLDRSHNLLRRGLSGAAGGLLSGSIP